MKLTLLIVSCLLFAAVHSAAVDLDSAHLTDAAYSLIERAAAQAPTKEEVKAILQQAEVDLKAAIQEVDESDPEPVVSTGAKRSASPGQWTLEIEPIAVVDGKRSPQWDAGVNYDINSNRLGGSLSYNNGNHNFGASASYGQGGWSGGLSYTYTFRKRSA